MARISKENWAYTHSHTCTRTHTNAIALEISAHTLEALYRSCSGKWIVPVYPCPVSVHVWKTLSWLVEQNNAVKEYTYGELRWRRRSRGREREEKEKKERNIIFILSQWLWLASVIQTIISHEQHVVPSFCVVHFSAVLSPNVYYVHTCTPCGRKEESMVV